MDMDNLETFSFKLPLNSELLAKIKDFTPDELLLVFMIGMNAVISMKKQLINKENTEYIDKFKEDIYNQYASIISEKDRKITSLEIQSETEKSIYTNFIENEKTKIEKDAFFQYNTIIERKKDELDKTKEELTEKRIEIEKMRIEIDKKVNEQQEPLREEILNQRIEFEKYKNEMEMKILIKNSEEQQRKREEIDEITKQFNNIIAENNRIYFESRIENDKYKNEIQDMEEKYKTEMEMKILIKNSEEQEKKRKEIDELTDQFNTNILENNKICYESKAEIEKYKNEIREMEEKHKIDTEMTLLKKTIETEKKYQEELEQIKLYLRDVENEKNRLEEIIQNNEQNLNMRIEQATFNENKKEIEKRDLLINENNELKEQLNTHKSELHSKELLVEKITVEMLTKQIDETKRNNIPANIGNDGEQIFYNLTNDTFNDFDDFKIDNVSKNGGHQGDFILSFRKFSVLVDVKNYSYPVGSSERTKIKRDLEKNPQIKIAWLVSLQTKIDKFGKYPFMCEIINNSCIFYVNSLLLKNDPSETLKLLWCSTETLFDVILNKDNDNMELDKKRKNESRIYKICEDMMRLSKDGKLALNQVKSINEKLESSIQEILKEGISDFRENIQDVIALWCKTNLINSENKKLNVMTVYEMFKNENNDCNVSLDSFKIYLKGIFQIKAKSFKNIPNIDFKSSSISIIE
jgi:hypothetical protein